MSAIDKCYGCQYKLRNYCTNYMMPVREAIIECNEDDHYNGHLGEIEEKEKRDMEA